MRVCTCNREPTVIYVFVFMFAKLNNICVIPIILVADIGSMAQCCALAFTFICLKNMTPVKHFYGTSTLIPPVGTRADYLIKYECTMGEQFDILSFLCPVVVVQGLTHYLAACLAEFDFGSARVPQERQVFVSFRLK